MRRLLSVRRAHFLVRFFLPVLAATAALILVFAGSGTRHLIQAAPAAQAPTQPPSARNGHALYQQNCAPCHGATGGGDGPTASQIATGVPALADPAIARKATPAEWFEITKEGRMDRFMPPWKNRLSDEEIWDAVAFAFTLHSSNAEIQRGEVVWGEQCAACHGDRGAGNGPQAVANNWQMPNLGDLDYAATQSLEAWFDVTSAGKGNMPGFQGALPDEDIWASLEFARTFSYQPLVAASLPKGDGRIAGKVVNGTPGASVPAGQKVTLRPFLGSDELRTQEADVAADGAYAFDGLPTGSDYVYLVTTDYGGHSFASDVVAFTDTQKLADAQVSIWENSDTPGQIRVELAQWFVQAHQGGLLIGELYRFNHDSDKLYLGGDEVAPGKRAVLTLNLPPEATSVVLDGGEIGGRYVRTNDGVIDTQPLPPGQTQILMRYLLPYSGTRADFEHKVAYPVQQLNVLVQQGPKVQSSTLQDQGLRAVGQEQFVSYGAGDLPAGKEVGIKLSGLEKADVQAATSTSAPNVSASLIASHPPLLYGLAGLAAAAVLGVLAFAFVRKPPEGQEPAPPAPAASGAASASGPVDLEAARQRLLEAIAELDDRYAAGELDDDGYQSTRTALKRNLLLVTRQLDTVAQETGSHADSPDTGSAANIDEEPA